MRRSPEDGVDSLPVSGRVLGIDVGYSRKRATTGICRLEWDASRVDWRCVTAKTDEASRLARLAELGLTRETPVEVVAIDGPLRPRLAYATGYRAPEAALSRGRFRRRGKPGATSGGGGRALHRAATDLAELALRQLHIRDAAVPVSVAPVAIVECFPNLFLGVLCEEADYPEPAQVRRRWTDKLFPLVRGRLAALLAVLLPARAQAGDWSLAGHEDVASLSCALAALCVAAGRFEAVGSPRDGYIVLPPEQSWAPAQSSPGAWAASELERTLLAARDRFPDLHRSRVRALRPPHEESRK